LLYQIRLKLKPYSNSTQSELGMEREGGEGKETEREIFAEESYSDWGESESWF
jgi:hypothetical protein